MAPTLPASAPSHAIPCFPSKFIEGRSTPSQNTPLAPLLPLQEALETEYPTDAHFACYGVEREEVALPRINKAAWPLLSIAGTPVFVSVIALDFDLPAAEGGNGKGGWQSWEQVDEVCGGFVCKGEGWEGGNFFALYTTRGGYRAVYALDKAIDPAEAEQIIGGMIESWASRGVQFDTACQDATRFFRLPKVSRDGERTEKSEFFILEIPGKICIERNLPRSDKKYSRPALGLAEIPKERPANDRLGRYLQTLTPKGRVGDSVFLKAAKKALEGTEAEKVVFQNAEIAPPQGPGRNTNIVRLAGQLCSRLASAKGACAQAIYALMAPVLELLAPDNETADWCEVGWDRIRHFWAIEQGRLLVAHEEKAKGQLEAMADAGAIVASLRTQLPNLAVLKDEATAAEWATRHYILTTKEQRAYIMQRDGKYSCKAHAFQQIPAAVTSLGMDKLIKLYSVGEDGRSKLRSGPELLAEYSSPVHRISVSAVITGGELETPDGDLATLNIAAYRRNPALTPLFNEQVHQWLQLLGGNDWETFKQWLSYAPAFEEGPMAALSIIAPPGIGKDLLAKGLSEILEQPALARPDDLVGDWQDGLLQSPFIFVNEGWDAAKGKRNPADAFRDTITGENIRINMKNMALVTLKAYPRVLLIGNNDGVVSKLADGRHLSKDDRDALEIRIVHMEPDGTAGEYLTRLGGLSHTGKKGAAWVGGQHKSDYILARHLLWMYEQRDPVPHGNRLLVQGTTNPKIQKILLVRNPSSLTVYKAIIEMSESNGRSQEGACFDSTGRLYILPSFIFDYINGPMRKDTGVRASDAEIQNVLKVLQVKEGTVRKPRALPERQQLGERMWVEVDLTAIASVALEYGNTCSKIKENYKVQRETGLIQGESVF